MNNIDNSKFVFVDTVAEDLGISKPMAYKVIKKLNEQLKQEYPNAIVIAGRVNRNWYNTAILENTIINIK